MVFGTADDSFRLVQRKRTGIRPVDIVVGDFELDGDIDAVTLNENSDDFRLYLNEHVAIDFGDINGDGLIDLLDIQPFVQVLVSGEYQIEADINCDGTVNLLDVSPFVEILQDG